MFIYHHKVYDDLRVYRGVKRTYRSCNNAAWAFTAALTPIWEMVGSASKTVRIQRIVLSGITLTAVAYHHVNLVKNSTASSGGTKLGTANNVAVPVDSGNAAATATNACYTAGPTAGTAVGFVGVKRVLAQATTAAAAGIPHPDVEFDFRNKGSADELVLRGVAQTVHLAYEPVPASNISQAIMVEWTESDE